MEFLRNLCNAYLIPFGGISGFAVFLVWLVKTLVDHNYAKAVEKHRSELEKEKTQYSDDLKKIAFVYQTKFSALHAQQAEFIKKLHGLLVKAKRIIDKLNTGPIEKQEGTFRDLSAALHEVESELNEGCIYLSKPLADRIQDLVWRFFNLSSRYVDAHVVLQEGGQDAVDFRRDLQKERQEMIKAVGDLQNEFRAILGSSLPIPAPADATSVTP